MLVWCFHSGVRILILEVRTQNKKPNDHLCLDIAVYCETSWTSLSPVAVLLSFPHDMPLLHKHSKLDEEKYFDLGTCKKKCMF